MVDFWERVKTTKKPIVLYGTGRAADRIIALLKERGKRISGVFSSDERVGERTFHSFKVLSYSEAKHIFGDMFIVMGFGTQNPGVIETVERIYEENEFYCPSLLLDENGFPFDSVYYEKHKADFDYFRLSLTDDRSRKIFDNIILFRLTGDIKYLLPIGEDEKTSWRAISFSSSETFVDVGAYTGDTILRFLEMTDSRYNRIIGFEPDKRSYEKALRNLRGKERIMLYNTLLSDRNEKTLFSEKKGRGNTHTLDGEERCTSTLDEMLSGESPSIIKFDAEGDEEKILEGGRKTISINKPALILSVYHRIDDFWRLMKKVKEINPDYSRFTLSISRSIPDWDIILIIQ